jgi:hypothetical protein
MKTSTVAIPIEVEVPTTSKEWWLYADKPGVERAVERLSAAFLYVMTVDNKAEVVSYLGWVSAQLIEFGAEDIEPKAVMADLLRRYHPAFRRKPFTEF